jgi:hypothetical protein
MGQYRKTFECLLLGLTTLFASCQGTTTTSPAASKSSSQSISTSDPKPNLASTHENWRRMKDCAEQTDRILKRMHLEEGQKNGNDDFVGPSQNHYSPKYERCFVQVQFYTSVLVLRKLQADDKKLTPHSYWTVYDAFEAKELTTCTDNRVESFCTIGGSAGDCSECREFTKDRMEN